MKNGQLAEGGRRHDTDTNLFLSNAKDDEFFFLFIVFFIIFSTLAWRITFDGSRYGQSMVYGI